MIDTLKSYFSSEKKLNRLEKKLQKAVSANDQEKIISIFSKEFRILLNEKNIQRLSNLFRSYGSAIENITLLEKEIPSDYLKQAIGLLEENELDAAALELCDYFGFDVEAIEILAKRGRANELTVHVTKDKAVDKELLQTAILCWEKYNGDIRADQTMCDVLKNIAKFSIESIPDNPRVREVIGEFEAAALLYVIEGNLSDAAGCYENAGMYREACKFYEYVGDDEGVSRAAESLGDLGKALEFVVKPERKVKLLIGMERFFEAREFAAGLEHPDEYFSLIKEMAKKRMGVKIKSSDFVGAMKLADVAECDHSTRKEILLLGREHFSREIASVASGEDAESIYRDWIKLEENAGNFEEAGRIAEDDLNDSELAIEYYKKANLIDRAIGIVDPDNLIKLAELHEKGGNLLKAANFYRSVEMYDKAYTLYESIQHFKEAIECYLKTPDPSRDVLIRLCTGAGEFERVVEIYMESGTFQDLEKALSIAKTYDLASHIRVIQDKITEHLSGSEADLKLFFTKAMDEVLGSYSTVFGIDFGTTNSVAAIFNKKSGETEIILTSNGSEFEPSFFGVDDDNHPIFGEAARLKSLVAPHTVIARVKRSIGTGKNFSIAGKKYRSEEVVAKILQRFRLNADTYLKSKAEARFYELLDANNLKFTEERLKKFLDSQKGNINIRDVVLSVPAYFNDSQKRATRDSAEIAGLRVRRLLHEPTAAALAYGYQRTYSGRLAVVDLGGGTLDISILDVGEGVYNIQTIGGDTKLGGSDIDLEIVRSVAENIKATIVVDIDEKTFTMDPGHLEETVRWAFESLAHAPAVEPAVLGPVYQCFAECPCQFVGFSFEDPVNHGVVGAEKGNVQVMQGADALDMQFAPGYFKAAKRFTINGKKRLVNKVADLVDVVPIRPGKNDPAENIFFSVVHLVFQRGDAADSKFRLKFNIIAAVSDEKFDLLSCYGLADITEVKGNDFKGKLWNIFMEIEGRGRPFFQCPFPASFSQHADFDDFFFGKIYVMNRFRGRERWDKTSQAEKKKPECAEITHHGKGVDVECLQLAERIVH